MFDAKARLAELTAQAEGTSKARLASWNDALPAEMFDKERWAAIVDAVAGKESQAAPRVAEMLSAWRLWNVRTAWLYDNQADADRDINDPARVLWDQRNALAGEPEHRFAALRAALAAWAGADEGGLTELIVQAEGKNCE